MTKYLFSLTYVFTVFLSGVTIDTFYAICSFWFQGTDIAVNKDICINFYLNIKYV